MVQNRKARKTNLVLNQQFKSTHPNVKPYIWVPRRLSYKRHRLLNLPEHMASPSILDGFILLIFLVFRVVFYVCVLFIFVLCFLFPVLPLSLYFAFLSTRSVSSNIYLWTKIEHLPIKLTSVYSIFFFVIPVWLQNIGQYLYTLCMNCSCSGISYRSWPQFSIWRIYKK